jgi:DNA polymerase III sliding clamp (beta) subunit (PCNA family)
MHCTWKSPSQCIKLFQAVHHTNPRVNIVFDTQGLHIMSMDSSKTCLVRLELTPSSFESFECTTPLTLGVDTESLVALLQTAKTSKLSWQVSTDAILSVFLAHEDQTTEFRLRAIDIDEVQLDIPERDDDMALQVAAPVLHEWMNQMLMAKAEVQFQITPHQFQCSSTAVQFGTIVHSEPLNGQRIDALAVRSSVDITLSYQSAKSMLVFSTCGDLCIVGFSNAQPSRLKVNLGSDGSHLCLFVSPAQR